MSMVLYAAFLHIWEHYRSRVYFCGALHMHLSRDLDQHSVVTLTKHHFFFSKFGNLRHTSNIIASPLHHRLTNVLALQYIADLSPRIACHRSGNLALVLRGTCLYALFALLFRPYLLHMYLILLWWCAICCVA